MLSNNTTIILAPRPTLPPLWLWTGQSGVIPLLCFWALSLDPDLKRQVDSTEARVEAVSTSTWWYWSPHKLVLNVHTRELPLPMRLMAKV
ncbi:hypothetical protein J1614_001524 [Plenodomus biglobosus]|nr:hypothetical protein J1614_001524 [Plenodomus biglobosus]